MRSASKNGVGGKPLRFPLTPSPYPFFLTPTMTGLQFAEVEVADILRDGFHLSVGNESYLDHVEYGSPLLRASYEVTFGGCVP